MHKISYPVPSPLFKKKGEIRKHIYLLIFEITEENNTNNLVGYLQGVKEKGMQEMWERNTSLRTAFHKL